jgi:hypothetical protein
LFHKGKLPLYHITLAQDLAFQRGFTKDNSYYQEDTHRYGVGGDRSPLKSLHAFVLGCGKPT